MNPADDLRARLREALRTAMRARDSAAVSALRSAMSVIDNAEAADLDNAPAPEISAHVAGGVAGLGAGEVRRKTLSAGDLRALIDGEISERRDQAEAVESSGHVDRANRLRAEVEALQPFRPS